MIQVSGWLFFTFCAGMVVTLIGASWTVGTVIARQFKSGLDQRFEAEAELRKQRDATLDEKFRALQQAISREGEGWRKVEHDLLALKAELPLHYQRREDAIRQEVVINTKLDALASKFDKLLAGSKA